MLKRLIDNEPSWLWLSLYVEPATLKKLLRLQIKLAPQNGTLSSLIYFLDHSAYITFFIIMSFRKPCHMSFRKFIPPFTLTATIDSLDEGLSGRPIFWIVSLSPFVLKRCKHVSVFLYLQFLFLCSYSLFFIILYIFSYLSVIQIIPSCFTIKEGRTRPVILALSSHIISSYCPRRDFAQKAKSRGDTLVTRAYINESTYSRNIQWVCKKKSR